MITTLVRTALVMLFATPLIAGGPPPPPTVVSHIVRSGHDLPMIDGDIAEVRIEPVGACELHYMRTSVFVTDAAALPASVPHTSWAYGFVSIHGDDVSIYGDDVFRFDLGASHSGTITITGVDQTDVIGPIYEPLAASPARVITDPVRCDRFEGVGLLDLGWSFLSTTAFYPPPGVVYDFESSEFAIRTHDFALRVTYTLR